MASTVREPSNPGALKQDQIRATDGESQTLVSSPLVVPPRTAKLTHYLFRYPAKFHPPVVRALLEQFTQPGQLVLDPFCGSGTLLVEAMVLGRNAFGIDVDPIAVAVANAKVGRYKLGLLKRSISSVKAELERSRRPEAEYDDRKFADLTDAEYERQAAPVLGFVPSIPNLQHWFRRYVIVDLAYIRRAILSLTMPASHRSLLLVVFGSIIRNASNADPVPVSGLEVTKWMKDRELAGRRVDPFQLFDKALESTLIAVEEFGRAARRGSSGWAEVGDATELNKHFAQKADAVLTSPPYHGAVDYYRRHQLEMFWLGLIESQQDRLALLQQYVGRPKVPTRHPWVSAPLTTRLAKEWEVRIRNQSFDRADAFHHYMLAMTRFFSSLRSRVRPGAPVLIVVGHSSWNNSEIPTSDLFDEISGDTYQMEDVLSYPVKNRYMSYKRHNDASISREYVLVMRRLKSRRRSAAK